MLPSQEATQQSSAIGYAPTPHTPQRAPSRRGAGMIALALAMHPEIQVTTPMTMRAIKRITWAARALYLEKLHLSAARPVEASDR